MPDRSKSAFINGVEVFLPEMLFIFEVATQNAYAEGRAVQPVSIMKNEIVDKAELLSQVC
jgi:hypothetical protein